MKAYVCMTPKKKKSTEKNKNVYVCQTSKYLEKSVKQMSFGLMSGLTDYIIHVSPRCFSIKENVALDNQTSG